MKRRISTFKSFFLSLSKQIAFHLNLSRNFFFIIIKQDSSNELTMSFVCLSAKCGFYLSVLMAAVIGASKLNPASSAVRLFQAII